MKLTNILCMAVMLCLMSACSTDPIIESTDSVNFESTINATNDLAFAEEVLDVLNAHRETLGLSPLQWDKNSENVATEHSAYMASQNRASHDNFISRSQYLKGQGAARVSENVAFGFRDAESVVAGWLGSPDHKAALEGDFTHTGIGVILNENNVPFFTQMFIK